MPNHRYIARHLFIFALLLGVIFCAYLPSIKGPWLYDDYFIKVYTNPDGLLNWNLGYRKVAYLSFYLNTLIDPIDTLNFRLTNIFIHAINSFLVYLLTLNTIRLIYDGHLISSPFTVATVSALIFGLHPLNVPAVSYIVQRMTSLAAMFSLLALLFSIRAFLTERPIKKACLIGLSLLFVIVAVFSKENAVVTIPLIGIYIYVLMRPHISIRATWQIWVFLGLVLVISAIFAYYFSDNTKDNIVKIFTALTHPYDVVPTGGWIAMDLWWTPYQHILTEFRVLCRYLLLLFFPIQSMMVFDWYGFPISEGLFKPPHTALCAAFIIFLLLFGISKIRKLPLLSLGIIWYLTAISLESFIAVGMDIYFEHRNYLPSVGLIVGVTGHLSLYLDKIRPDSRVIKAAVTLLLVLLFTQTYQRNLLFSDASELWADTVKKTPVNMRAIAALCNSYLENVQTTKADNCLESGIKTAVDNKYSGYFKEAMLYNLGMRYIARNDLPKVSLIIDTMIKDQGGNETPRISLLKANHLIHTGKATDAADILNELLDYETLDIREKITALIFLGDVYRKTDDLDNALHYYKEALKSDPSLADVYFRIGLLFIQKDDMMYALRYMKEALKYNKHHIDALCEAAEIMLILKADIQEAFRYAQQAVSLSSSDNFFISRPYIVLANILLYKNNKAEANRLYDTALSLGVDHYIVAINKARVYNLLSNKVESARYLREAMRDKRTPDHIKRVIKDMLQSNQSNEGASNEGANVYQ